MKFEERQEQGALVVRPLEKRLDAYVAEEFKGHMKGLAQNGHLQLVLDLSDVEFVDSSGLGAIISTMMALRPQGRLMVCNAGDNVLSLFRLTRMDRVIPVMPDAGEALRVMASEREPANE
jgi:anti-sigma B factor antagonist